MVFKRFAKSNRSALYIGAPEAEAESLPTSKVCLKDVYEDHHNLFEELSHEKFIIVGRKGCGKSAFAEYAQNLAMEDANLFCTFIRQDSVSLETLVQLGKSVGTEQTKEHLFKWLIYTNLLKMFLNNEAAADSPKFRLLKEFMKKNSGYIDIDKGEVTELVKKHKFQVNIDQFKRFFKTSFNKDIKIKESRAEYYKLLPHLEDVLVDVLQHKVNVENQNSYVIFFDDLDIGFKASDTESVDTLLSLIRTSKHVNNTVFAKNNASAKVIILIRDDVERLLSPLGADIAKIFSSYSTELNWYQEEFLNDWKEDQIGLKKLIVKRIDIALTRADISRLKNAPGIVWFQMNSIQKLVSNILQIILF
ncbi:P-loop ATPase, Sll1717 family [Photobacterium leiognathi subsp. mandapamensis]|uniref:P-loop ATPase, Sll1717 family n=1 Tax=Photobacterium leiognathi TaxID=553611 RepID=UPI003AF36621